MPYKPTRYAERLLGVCTVRWADRLHARLHYHRIPVYLYYEDRRRCAPWCSATLKTTPLILSTFYEYKLVHCPSQHRLLPAAAYYVLSLLVTFSKGGGLA